MLPHDAEDPWKGIARRKRAQRDSAIPMDWRLDHIYLPKDNGEPENVLAVPHQCGILSAEELQITSNYDAGGIIREITSR